MLWATFSAAVLPRTSGSKITRMVSGAIGGPPFCSRSVTRFPMVDRANSGPGTVLNGISVRFEMT
jgi:hypothetical protein